MADGLHSNALPEGESEGVTAGGNEHPDAPSNAPSALAPTSLPALNKKIEIHSSSAKKVSAQEQQYKEAISMSSAELGAAIMAPTSRITKHIGSALAHEEVAKNERAEAQSEFERNIAFYYETKRRLLNPGYRTDVDGGKDRTPDQNQEYFGAPDWATFNSNCKAYSLQHADRLLKRFAQANGLLTDDGENIDDHEPEEVEPAEMGRRHTKDVTAQRRYEHIAIAAVEIAKRNPEGEVEKQILAAAEYVPAPLMPLPLTYSRRC
jgi:hypothetical protein